MLGRQTYLGIVMVATSALVSSQSNQSQPPDFKAGSATKALSSAMAASAHEREVSAPGEAEILTDTRGVDFSFYINQIRPDVRSHWMALVPSHAYPPFLKGGDVSIDFYIRKDGKVEGTKIHKSSGEEALDHAALGSVTSSNPLPPLPSDFTGERIGVRFHYFYNVQPGVSFNITPSFDVQVPAGSALQFSVSGEEIGGGSVRWSVSGPGCSESTCGKISRPGSIPHLPTFPSLQRSSCERYCEVIQIPLKSLSCRQLRRTSSASRQQGIIPRAILNL
jgi:TonB family protein